MRHFYPKLLGLLGNRKFCSVEKSESGNEEKDIFGKGKKSFVYCSLYNRTELKKWFVVSRTKYRDATWHFLW